MNIKKNFINNFKSITLVCTLIINSQISAATANVNYNGDAGAIAPNISPDSGGESHLTISNSVHKCSNATC